MHQTEQYGVCSDALVCVFNSHLLRQLIDGRFARPIRHARVADLADRCDRRNVDDGAAGFGDPNVVVQDVDLAKVAQAFVDDSVD